MGRKRDFFPSPLLILLPSLLSLMDSCVSRFPFLVAYVKYKKAQGVADD